MDMQGDKDFFELYLDKFPDAPSLVLVRSVEAKNFPISVITPPVLDLCCGDGFFALTLGLKDISGCDISEHAINIAKEKGIYDNLRVCDIKKMPFQDNSFNSVISNCALEHVEGIENALLEIHRVLTPEGILIMTVPSEFLLEWFPPKNLFEIIGLKKLGQKLLDKYNYKQSHINIFSLEKWKNLLNDASFKVETHFYIFSEKSYKFAITLDWLFNLGIFNKINYFSRFIFPPKIKKAFWRKILKQYYKNSFPLTDGGELVIVARNKK